MWIKCFINKISLEISCLILNGNNKASINPNKNFNSLNNIKHINMQYHYIQKLVNHTKFTMILVLGMKILANTTKQKLYLQINLKRIEYC